MGQLDQYNSVNLSKHLEFVIITNYEKLFILMEGWRSSTFKEFSCKAQVKYNFISIVKLTGFQPV